MTALVLVKYSFTKENDTALKQYSQPVIAQPGEPTGIAEEKVIRSEGGTVNSADGALSVIIPYGALSSATNIATNNTRGDE